MHISIILRCCLLALADKTNYGYSSVSQESEGSVYGCIKMSQTFLVLKTLPVCLVRFQVVLVSQWQSRSCIPLGTAASAGELGS